MSDLPTISAQPLDLSEFDNPAVADLRTLQRRIVELAAQTTDPLDSVELQRIAFTKLKLPAAGFKSAVTLEKKAIKLRQQALAEVAGAKAVSLEGDSPLYFDGAKYYRKEDNDKYGTLAREDALLHLSINGYNTKRDEGSPSSADRALHALQKSNRIDFAGPICGRPPGRFVENGQAILCTSGPTMVETSDGEFPLIQTYLDAFFGKGTCPHFQTQVDIIEAWIKLGRVAVRNPLKYLPGQVLAIAGPPDCGKSMFQKMVLTPAFGGRVMDPGLWLQEKTTFNEDMWGAEHLALGDKKLEGTYQAREDMRDQLKELVASPVYPFHPKNRKGQAMSPVWRVSLTINSDQTSLNNMPALKGGFEDKLIILKAYSPTKSLWDFDDPDGREKFETQIGRELPHYLHHIDNKEIPTELRKGRFGVTEWHNPQIVELMTRSDPIQYMEAIIEQWLRDKAMTADSEMKKKGFVHLQSNMIFAQLDRDYNVVRSKLCTGERQLGHVISELSERSAWRDIISNVRMPNGNSTGWRFQIRQWLTS